MESVQEKLDNACLKITSQLEVFENFLERVNRWIKHNNFKAVELFKKFDKDGDGILTFDEFKAGLVDLDAPCNAIELEILSRRMDKDGNKTIDYREFAKGLSFDDDPNWRPELVTTRQALEPCPFCKIGLWKPDTEKSPRYLKLRLKFLTFDNIRSYPGHFELILHSHLTIYGLIDIIKTKMELATTTLRIYWNKSRDGTSLLMPDRTLKDYGFKGGTRSDPEEYVLYYDYLTEFHDCSILMSDYYFAS